MIDLVDAHTVHTVHTWPDRANRRRRRRRRCRRSLRASVRACVRVCRACRACVRACLPCMQHNGWGSYQRSGHTQPLPQPKLCRSPCRSPLCTWTGPENNCHKGTSDPAVGFPSATRDFATTRPSRGGARSSALQGGLRATLPLCRVRSHPRPAFSPGPAVGAAVLAPLRPSRIHKRATNMLLDVCSLRSPRSLAAPCFTSARRTRPPGPQVKRNGAPPPQGDSPCRPGPKPKPSVLGPENLAIRPLPGSRGAARPLAKVGFSADGSHPRSHHGPSDSRLSGASAARGLRQPHAAFRGAACDFGDRVSGGLTAANPPWLAPPSPPARQPAYSYHEAAVQGGGRQVPPRHLNGGCWGSRVSCWGSWSQ